MVYLQPKKQDSDYETKYLIKQPKPELETRAPLRVLLQFSTGFDYFLLVLALLTNLIFSIFPIYLTIKISDIVDSMEKYGEDLNEFYRQERELAWSCYVLGILSVVFSWISVVAFLKFGSNQGLGWKKAYFEAIIRKPIKWFDKHNASELSSSIGIECNLIEGALGEKTLIVMSAVLLFTSGWIVCFVFCPLLTSMAFFILPFQFLSAIIIKKAAAESESLTQEKYKTAGGIAEESIEGIKTIASCNAQETCAKRYQEELRPLKRSSMIVGLVNGIGWALFFVVLFTYSGVFFYAGAYIMVNEPIVLGLQAEASPSKLIFVFFNTAFTSFYLGNSMPCMQSIDAGRVAACQINKVIKKSKKFDGNTIAETLEGSINFEDVYFNYPLKPDVNILNGVSFTVNSGDSLAVVGETGSGKSTIIQLIQGFYYVDSGLVSIDGIDIREYDLKSLRDHIGIVSQEPVLFNCSIRENIRIGKLGATNQDIEEAAKDAEVNMFIENLPDKYDTWAGVKGSQLSGGQKQRIAIARAIIKKPKILLLDEATSALDMVTERKIQKTLEKVMENRTTIIVAQRLSTIKRAKRIIVLDEGRIIESGTYDTLLNSNGAFSRLLNTQDTSDSKSSDMSQTQSNKDFISEITFISREVAENTNLETISRIMVILKQYWIWIILSLIAAVVSGLTFPIFGYLYAYDTNTLLGINGSDIVNEAKYSMYLLLIDSAVIFVSLIALCFILARISALYTYDLRYKSILSLLYFDQRFYDMPESSPASLAFNLGNDCDKVSKVGGPILGLQLFILSAFAFGIAISMQFNILLTLIVIGLLPLLTFSNMKTEMLNLAGMTTGDFKRTSVVASDSLTNIKTVNSFNRQEYFIEKYDEASKEESAERMKSSHSSGFYFGFKYFALYAVWGSVAWLGAYLIKHELLKISDLNIVFFTVIFSTWGFVVAGAVAPDIGGGIKSAKKLFKIIDYVPDINALSDSGVTDEIIGKVEFYNVCFSYEGRDTTILKELNFVIAPGQRFGITGTTGSGKSTICQLLMRFYNPTAGEIFIDNTPISVFNIKHLRNSICWVGQEPILFKGGIFFNLQLAQPDLSRDEAMNALAKAQASDIVELYGLDTDVGLRGTRLSGGQKQRVAIARVLVRKPKVVIFDESTSALDSLTEMNLQNSIKNEKFTIISIAHKLKTLRNYDVILMLEAGRVVESGTHDDLMKIPEGLYKNLYNSSE